MICDCGLTSRKACRLGLPEDRRPLSSPRPGKASNVTEGHVEVFLRRISLDLVVFLYDLRFSSSAVVVALMHSSFGALHDDFPYVY